jgi:hypothetical protein
MMLRDSEWSDEKWAVGGLLGLLFLSLIALSFPRGDHSTIAAVAAVETTGQSTGPTLPTLPN